ncbi:MAG TPA: hypothetical protein VI876_12765 [Dehalococcoidia bacterium]|nr:hypothetical protein [Dehalococcoidia bacterium]
MSLRSGLIAAAFVLAFGGGLVTFQSLGRAQEGPDLDQILGKVGRGDTTVALTLRDGQLDGGELVKVPYDHRLTFNVSSDVDEELHIEGYHMFTQLRAGQTVTAHLWTGTAGAFHIRLEKSSRVIGLLDVSEE